MNEEQRSIILQTKNVLRRLLIMQRYLEFSENVDWKMLVIILLEMRNSEFEIFFESGFSDRNHCLKLPCSISEDSQALQLNCDRKHLAIAFNSKEPATI